NAEAVKILIFAAEGLTKRSAVGFLLRSLIMFQTFISRHNSNFFSDKLVLTSVTPASSAPVLQTPKATSSTLYFDSLTVNAGNGGFLHCIQMDTSVNAANQVVSVAADIAFDADPKFFACLVRFESSSVPTTLPTAYDVYPLDGRHDGPSRLPMMFILWMVAMMVVIIPSRTVWLLTSFPVRRAIMFMLVSWFGLTLPLLNAADWFRLIRLLKRLFVSSHLSEVIYVWCYCWRYCFCSCWWRHV